MTSKPETVSDVADDQLAAFVDRVIRMKGEEDAIKADIREIYAEAKAMGYDKTRVGDVVTHVRKHEKDATGEAEKEAIRDLYLTAYYRAKNKPHTHAYARGVEKPSEGITKFTSERGPFSPKSAPEEVTPEHDADGVEIEPQSPHTAAQAGPVDAPVSSTPVESAAAEISTPIQPETANETQSSGSTVTDGGQELSVSSAPASAIESEDSASDAGQAPSNLATLRQPKPMRPNCLKPDMCGGQGRQHCWTCTKAINEAGAA